MGILGPAQTFHSDPQILFPSAEGTLVILLLAEPHLSYGPFPPPFDVAFLPLKCSSKVTFSVLESPFPCY